MFGSYIAIARRIAAGNRWLVVAFAVLAGLWALEYIAHGAIGVVRDLMTVKATIEQTRAQSCSTQIDAAFGGSAGFRSSLELKRLPDAMARKLLADCGEYFDKRPKTVAHASLTPMTDDLALEELGLKRSGSKTDDAKLVCIARTALHLMIAYDLNSDEALKRARTPGNKLVASLKDTNAAGDEEFMQCQAVMAAIARP